MEEGTYSFTSVLQYRALGCTVQIKKISGLWRKSIFSILEHCCFNQGEWKGMRSILPSTRSEKN